MTRDGLDSRLQAEYQIPGTDHIWHHYAPVVCKAEIVSWVTRFNKLSSWLVSLHLLTPSLPVWPSRVLLHPLHHSSHQKVELREDWWWGLMISLLPNKTAVSVLVRRSGSLGLPTPRQTVPPHNSFISPHFSVLLLISERENSRPQPQLTRQFLNCNKCLQFW